MNSVDEQIRLAIEKGEFDNLPGKGKPLNLEENPFEDPEWRTANRFLRNSGFTLPWINMRREIDKEIMTARVSLQRTWVWQQRMEQEDHLTHAYTIEWEDALHKFKVRIESLNKKILVYNLEVPSTLLQIPQLNAEEEYRTLIEENTA
jgi:DnaJ family protein C protein 28